MNAPPHLATTASDGDVVHWLMNETRDQRFVDNIFAELWSAFSARASPSSDRRCIS